MESKIRFGNYVSLAPAGSGGCGQVFAVELEGNSKKEAFILKTLKEGEDTPDNRENLKNEINMLIELNKNSQIESIPKIFYPKEGYDKEDDDNIINEKKTNEKLYYVTELFSKENLFYYIENGGFSEKYAQVIFKKIVEAIKFCHNKGICHLDIKPANIVFDKNFEPVIIDFGYAAKFMDGNKKKFFTGYKGTPEYESPDMKAREKYDGEKCDIFSLGAVLFNLVTGKPGFITSWLPDKFYRKIIKKNYEKYWKSVFNAGVTNDLTENFKNLYLKMVAFNPNERATMKDILESPWLQEYNNLSQEKKDDLEKKVNEELLNRYNAFKDCNSEIESTNHIIEGYAHRGIDEEESIFSNNLSPKKIPNDRINMNHHIIIKGYINGNKFMNSLYNRIEKMFKNQDEFFIEASENYLKFEVTLENKIDKSIYDKDDENDDEVDENKDVIEPLIPNTKMVIELFQYEDGRYLLEFLRTGGEIKDYYKYFLKIKEIIKEIL